MSPAISGQMLSASKAGNENTRISVYNANTTGNAAIASLHLNNNVTNGYVSLYGNNAGSHANMTSLENDSSGGGLLLYSASPNGPIQFKVGSGVERMRLSKEGYLGIGSGGVSPLAALDINGNGNQIWIRPGPGGGIGGGATAGLKLEYTPGNEGVIQTYDYTGSGTAKKLSLNYGGGAVGIGLTAPNDLVSLYVKQAANGAIAFGSQTVYSVLGLDASNNMVLNAWSGHVFQMGGNEKVRFASDGKVGIGTNSPQQLFVVSAGGTSGIECVPGFQTNLSIIQTFNRGTTTYDTLDLRGSDFKFRIGTTEKIGINSTGDVSILSATNSTTKTTGALTVAGGLGVAGPIYAGGLEANTVTASDTTASNSTTTGSMIVKGGAGIAGTVNAAGVSAGTGTFTSLTATNFSLTNALTVTSLTSGAISSSGTIEFTNVTDATSSSSGAVKVSGGVGIAKKLFVGSTVDSTSISTGALVVSGGAGISGAVYAVGVTSSGAIRVTDTTASTASNTGALTVAGGAGVAGALYVGARATANAITTATGISFGAGSASMPVPTGNAPMFAARAWACLQWSGTAFTMPTSGNISTLSTNVSARTVTLNFATNMPTSNYAVYADGTRLSAGDFTRSQITSSASGSVTVRIEGADGSQILDNGSGRLTDLFVIVVA
jgi:hypothetical protein